MKVLIPVIILAAAVNLQAADITFQWTGGTSGYSGTLVLDTTSSTAGTINDIVSLTVATPKSGGPLTVDTTTLNLLDPAFQWNSSQVSEMYVSGTDAGGDTIFFGENVFDSGENILAVNFDQDQAGDSDLSGSWTPAPTSATVPELSSTAWLLGAVAAGMAGLKRFKSSAR